MKALKVIKVSPSGPSAGRSKNTTSPNPSSCPNLTLEILESSIIKFSKLNGPKLPTSNAYSKGKNISVSTGEIGMYISLYTNGGHPSVTGAVILNSTPVLISHSPSLTKISTNPSPSVSSLKSSVRIPSSETVALSMSSGKP